VTSPARHVPSWIMVRGIVGGLIAAALLFAAIARWFRQQSRLHQLVVDDERFQPPIAGRFHNGRRTRHPWLRVLAAGHHSETGEMYYLIQESGSGAGWLKASEIDLYPDEPSP
jgi:hypothetical protein